MMLIGYEFFSNFSLAVFIEKLNVSNLLLHSALHTILQDNGYTTKNAALGRVNTMKLTNFRWSQSDTRLESTVRPIKNFLSRVIRIGNSKMD